jgi:hypothetical protein
MAIAGGGIPSFQVRIRDGELVTLGQQVNIPAGHVQCDMVLAAETLRRNPTKSIRIDALRFRDLRDYLRNSGHVE